MPASYSAPIEPYLKRISGVDVTHCGCGSSRKNFCQPISPPAAATNTTIARQTFQPIRFFSAAIFVPPDAPDRVCTVLRLRPPDSPLSSSPHDRVCAFMEKEPSMTLRHLSKRLEILHQSLFLGRGKLRPVPITL